MRKNNRQNGFVAIASVLILSAILFSISISIASRSIGGAGDSVAIHTHAQAKALAHACAEYALMELQRTLDYAGGETRTIAGETCDIVDVSGTGNTERTVQARSTVSGFIHRTEVSVSEVSPEMTISSWSSVEQF